MTYDMPEEAKRFLTEEVLGECWHQESMCYPKGKCAICGCSIFNRRTFTTDQDMVDLFRGLVKMGKWVEFVTFVVGSWYSSRSVNDLKRDDFHWKDLNPYLVQWLFLDNPQRACYLVWQLMKGEGK
jgi:hypothetical protein